MDRRIHKILGRVIQQSPTPVRILGTSEYSQNMVSLLVLKGIEYNSSTKGKCASDINEIVSTNCESEKWNTEVEKDKKVSFDNVTNAG